MNESGVVIQGFFEIVTIIYLSILKYFKTDTLRDFLQDSKLS